MPVQLFLSFSFSLGYENTVTAVLYLRNCNARFLTSMPIVLMHYDHSVVSGNARNHIT